VRPEDQRVVESEYLECRILTSESPLHSNWRIGGGRKAGQHLAVLICLLFLPARLSSSAPTDLDHLQQAAELMNAGDLAGAETEAKLALRDPSTRPVATATLGAIRVRQKRYTEATEFLNTALRLNPGLVGARVTVGEVYVLTGKKALARQVFNKVLAVEPDNRKARFALAQLETDSSNFGASLKIAEPVLIDLRRSPDGILLLATDYAGLEEKDLLLSLVHDWQGVPQASAASSTAFSSLLAKSGLTQQALDVLEKAKSSGQVSYDMALALGNLYFSKGDASRAFGSYEAALSLSPGCVHCLLQMAKIAEQQNDPEKALAYLIKAKKERRDNPEVLFEFGKTCLQLDLPDDAISALQTAAHLRPDNDSYAYVLGSANVAKKQYEAAGKLFQALLSKHPNDSTLNYAMGSLLFLEVKLGEAAKYLRKSIDLQPNQIAAYYYLGLIAEGKGENDEAIATLRDVLRRDPDYGPAYEALGGLLLKQHKYAEAEQALQKAVQLNPDSVKAHYQLGILMGRTGRQEDANKEFGIVHQINAEEEKRSGMRLRILTPH
jgi:tetratricopeptide (TPR) repeat protein